MTSSRSGWLPRRELDGVPEPGQRPDRARDHHVDLAVLRVGLGRAAPRRRRPLGPLPTATFSTGWSTSTTTSPSTSTRSRTYGRLEGGQRGADRVAELAEVEPAVADPAEPVLPAGAAPAGLRAGADVDVVDHDLADLVDDQVDRAGPRPRPAAAPRPRCRAGCPSPGRSRCRCRAGSARARRRSRSLRRCSAATTACRLPSPPATTIVREPRGAARRRARPGSRSRRPRPTPRRSSDASAPVERLLVGRAGVAVGDDQQ